MKKDLWNVIKSSRTPPEYVTDKIVKEKGYFCLIFMLTEIKEVVYQGFEKVTPIFRNEELDSP